MGFFSDLFGYSKEVQDLVNWICEHDTYEYLGNPGRGYCADEYYYNYSVDSLKHIKEQMMQKHAKLEYDRKHPKPKIGDVYSVYLCGKHVDTLRTMTACDGDRLSLCQVSADNFVTLWFTTTIG